MGLFLTESTFCFLLLGRISRCKFSIRSGWVWALWGWKTGVTATPDPYGMTNKGTGSDSHKGKGNNDNDNGHDKSGSGIWGLEVGGVEEGEEDAAEGGFAAGGVVPLL
jgi:hypothetical protein